MIGADVNNPVFLLDNWYTFIRVTIKIAVVAHLTVA